MSPLEVTEHQLFATSIYRMTLKGYGIFNQKFEDFIYKEKDKDPLGNTRSNYGGWHSKQLDFNEEIIEEFCSKVDPILINLGKNLGWDMENYYLGFNELWSIINKKGDFNNPHRHGNSILSLAYYAKSPKNGGDIYFVDPRVAGIPRKPLLNKEKNQELLGKTHNIDKLVFPPKEGMLLLFPGWLEHGVFPSKSDEDRIVISANINFFPSDTQNDKIIHNASIYT